MCHCDRLLVTKCRKILFKIVMCRENTGSSLELGAWMIHRSVLRGLTRTGLKMCKKKNFERPSESLENYCSRALQKITRKSGCLEAKYKYMMDGWRPLHGAGKKHMTTLQPWYFPDMFWRGCISEPSIFSEDYSTVPANSPRTWPSHVWMCR